MWCCSASLPTLVTQTLCSTGFPPPFLGCSRSSWRYRSCGTAWPSWPAAPHWRPPSRAASWHLCCPASWPSPAPPPQRPGVQDPQLLATLSWTAQQCSRRLRMLPPRPLRHAASALWLPQTAWMQQSRPSVLPTMPPCRRDCSSCAALCPPRRATCRQRGLVPAMGLPRPLPLLWRLRRPASTPSSWVSCAVGAGCGRVSCIVGVVAVVVALATSMPVGALAPFSPTSCLPISPAEFVGAWEEIKAEEARRAEVEAEVFKHKTRSTDIASEEQVRCC